MSQKTFSRKTPWRTIWVDFQITFMTWGCDETEALYEITFYPKSFRKEVPFDLFVVIPEYIYDLNEWNIFYLEIDTFQTHYINEKSFDSHSSNSWLQFINFHRNFGLKKILKIVLNMKMKITKDICWFVDDDFKFNFLA